MIKVTSQFIKVTKTVKWLFFTVVTILLLLFSVNLIWTLIEKGNNPPPGQMVAVDGKRMHVFTDGNGPINVILLSGLGAPSPVIDFMPLVHHLKKEYRVSVVEYFGYGWSDDTNKSRSIDNVVEEIRAALKGVGVSPPYVLVPHSFSGLHALVFSNRYPSEVSAIVGLDISVPEQMQYMPEMHFSGLSPFLRIFGIVRIALLVDPSLSTAYTSKEFSDDTTSSINMMVNWNYGNEASKNEIRQAKSNLKDTQTLIFTKNIPVNMILSSHTINNPPFVLPKDFWESSHRTIVEGNPQSKVIVLNGEHCIYHDNTEKVVEIINETINIIDARITK